MYSLTDYKELKEMINKRSFRLPEKYAYIEKAVDVESILLSYGKNIFDKISTQEIYLISKTKIFIITWEPFIIKTYRTKDIVSTQLELKSPYNISMKICISNGDIIELDNIKDINEDWQTEYYEYILQVNNTLTNL